MTKNKRGQISIFVILGILLISVILLLFFLYDRQISPIIRESKEPKSFLSDCVNGYVEEAVTKIIENTGYVEMPTLTHRVEFPEGYYRQEPIREVPFLCYTALNYYRCSPIENSLINHVEEEIYNYVEPKINTCFFKSEGKS